MKKLKIIFFCGERSPWGYAHLEPLFRESRFELVAVVMASNERWRVFRRALSGVEPAPENWCGRARLFLAKLMGRGSLDRTKNTMRFLARHKIPLLFCDDANDARMIESLKDYAADLILSAAYPQLFRSELLNLLPGRIFNSHPSKLPRCQGAHPVFWAIASGESKSGSTIHVMTPELDKGDIVAQVEVALSETETYSKLYANLIVSIPDLLARFADFLTTPGSKAAPQDQSHATYFRNDREIHRRIFWSEMDAQQIHNLVRACEGSAFFWQRDHRVFVQKTEPFKMNRNMTNEVKVPPGAIVDLVDGAPVVATRKGFVRLLKVHASRLGKDAFAVGMLLS